MPTKGHRDILVPITQQKLIKKLPFYLALQLGAETTLALSFADWQRTGSNAMKTAVVPLANDLHGRQGNESVLRPLSHHHHG